MFWAGSEWQSATTWVEFYESGSLFNCNHRPVAAAVITFLLQLYHRSFFSLGPLHMCGPASTNTLPLSSTLLDSLESHKLPGFMRAIYLRLSWAYLVFLCDEYVHCKGEGHLSIRRQNYKALCAKFSLMLVRCLLWRSRVDSFPEEETIPGPGLPAHGHMARQQRFVNSQKKKTILRAAGRCIQTNMLMVIWNDMRCKTVCPRKRNHCVPMIVGDNTGRMFL